MLFFLYSIDNRLVVQKYWEEIVSDLFKLNQMSEIIEFDFIHRNATMLNH